jgi:hypothetical protein
MKRKSRVVLMGAMIMAGWVIAGVPGPAGYSLGWTTLRASVADDPASGGNSANSSGTSAALDSRPTEAESFPDGQIESGRFQPVELDGETQEFQVRFVEVLMGSSDDIGIDWVFGWLPGENPPVNTAAFGGYGRIEELRNDDQVSILSDRQFASLLLRFEQKSGIDLLTMPSISEFFGYDDPSASVDPVVQARVRELKGIAQLPLPRMRTRKAGGRIWVEPGQTVALRGPSGTRRRVTKEGFWIFKKQRSTRRNDVCTCLSRPCREWIRTIPRSNTRCHL